jgi:ubiquinone/menaquinone biosynthesis C-methylase UbiE
MIGLRSRFVEVVGADISPAMVAIASGRARAEGIADRIRFRVGDAAALPFPDGSFDLVLSTLSLHHWSKPEQAAREMWRVLKDGGEAWIYDLRADTSREMEEEIRRKYGRFPAFLILVVIRAHSSISLTNAREALFNGAGRFREMETLDRGIFLHLRLRK